MDKNITVLVFLNEILPTSIPFETAKAVAAITPATVIVASLYDDNCVKETDNIPSNIQIESLRANSRFDIQAYQTLGKIAKSQNADVLHTHHNSTGSLARLALSLSDISIVNTEHRNHESFSPLQIFTNCVSYPSIDNMVANSEETANSYYGFERLLLSGTKQSVVYNGIDIERIHNAKESSLTRESSKTIVSVGRLIDVKNQKTLIRAFKSIHNRFPQSRLILVGDGPRRGQLKQYAKTLGIRDYVEFTGQVSREEVYEILKSSNIFVIPSHSEGFCVAAVEAMACGLPVVCSDIDVLHEVVGDSGLYFNPDDNEALSEHIEWLLTSDEARKQLGEDLERRATSRFPIERTAQEYYKIYKRLAKQDEQ